MKKEPQNILIVTDRSDYFSFLGTILEKWYRIYYIAVREKDEKILQEKGKNYISLQEMLKEFDKEAGYEILDKSEIEEALFHDIIFDNLYQKGRHKDLIIAQGQKYVIECSKIFESYNINLVIIQNDLWNYGGIALKVARKTGIKTLIFEDGLFRPNTVTVDEKGVNFFNSLPRDRDFYENLVINKERLQNFLTVERSKLSQNKIKFPLSFRSKRVPDIYQELKLHFQDSSYNKRTPTNYLFLPLQVRFDSQILCHSSIKNMRDLAQICISALKKYNERTKKQLALVIKEHPKDRYLIDLKRFFKKPEVEVIFLKQVDTRKLIKESSLVITINSTVGIESLLYYKPVITLGRAFYNIDGIVYHCDNFRNLDILIEKALNTPVKQDLINKFLYYLKFYYQVDGNLDYPDEKNILPVVARIKEVLER